LLVECTVCRSILLDQGEKTIGIIVEGCDKVIDRFIGKGALLGARVDVLPEWE